VVGKPGHEYQIRVSNRLRDELLAVTSVDGVNVITGETANPSQSGYVLSPRGRVDIQGWRKSLSQTAAFYFTALPDSYAARTGRPDNVGVIGVAVFRKRAEPEARIDTPGPRREAPASAPRDDSPFPSGADMSGNGLGGMRSAQGAAKEAHGPEPRSMRRSPSLGTGHGRSESSHITYTSFERATASPEDVIAIHYNTYANLVAMGVIRAPRAAVPGVPTPFPGQFVPDPR